MAAHRTDRNAGKRAGLGFYLTGLNRLAEAESALHKAIELQPDGASFYQGLATIAVVRGDAQAALAAAQHEVPGTIRKFAVALARQIGCGT